MEYFVNVIFNNRYSCCRSSQQSVYDSTNNILSFIIIIIIIIIIISLVTGVFFLVILLNQQWSPPLGLQASHCSTFRIMCNAPSIAVFCSETIECFPGTASKLFIIIIITATHIRVLLSLTTVNHKTNMLWAVGKRVTNCQFQVRMILCAEWRWFLIRMYYFWQWNIHDGLPFSQLLQNAYSETVSADCNVK